jgi:hypothetical protein
MGLILHAIDCMCLHICILTPPTPPLYYRMGPKLAKRVSKRSSKLAHGVPLPRQLASRARSPARRACVDRPETGRGCTERTQGELEAGAGRAVHRIALCGSE